MLPRHAGAALLVLVLLSIRCSAVPDLSEAAVWLQGYLRIDTTNPPGREDLAAEYLAGILRQEGIPFEIVKTPQGRANLWARLSSPRSGGKALLLLHHMDVVAAGPGWTVPPFSGRVHDGRLWGRGAVDDKSLGIAHLAALVELKRRNVPFARDVVFLAVADEENGGLQGTAWLLAHHPEIFRGVEAVAGEGGRNEVNPAGTVLSWGVEVAQKRPLWLEVQTTGRGGHGSGLNPESANHQLILGLARLLEMPPRWRVTAPARAYLAALTPYENDHWRGVYSRIDRIVTAEGPSEFLPPGIANLFLDTIQVTVLKGGGKINVIPGQASASLDIRMLPDTDGDALLATIRRTLGDDFRVRVLVTSPPADPSPASGRFYDAVRGVLEETAAPVVPAMVSGFTDSRFFRERGIPAYGLSPFALAADDLRGIHNLDERIPVAELDRGLERMIEIVEAYAASPR